MSPKLRTTAVRRNEARIQRCIECYKADPSEALALKIVKKLRKLKRLDPAFRWAKHARSKYPRSRKLLKLYQKLKKKKVARSLLRVQRKIQVDPSAANMVQHCELLRMAGGWKKACKVASRADREFPDHWQVQLVLGKLNYDLYARHGSEDDGWTAVEYLDNSRCLNPNNYATLILLAITLTRLGSYDDALAIVDEAMQVVPQDQRALQLRDRIQRILAAQSLRGGGAATAPQLSPPSEEVAELMERLLTIDGAVGVHFLDDGSKLLSCSVRENDVFNFDVPPEVFESMASACRLPTERIGLGDFHCCSLAGEGWSVDYHTTSLGPVLAFFAGSFTSEQICNEVNTVLGPSEGASSADATQLAYAAGS
ncbi:MAG: tetratricopeptide repeat protein [Planctomycetota bacterium]|nr:tetratricopeptide repeat protein [Planctomycetota bacterium]